MNRTAEARTIATNANKKIAKHANTHTAAVNMDGTGNSPVKTDVAKEIVTDDVSALQGLFTPAGTYEHGTGGSRFAVMTTRLAFTQIVDCSGEIRRFAPVIDKACHAPWHPR
jgi:hypothetical protein